MNEALLMKGITKIYPNGVMANHDITLEVRHGEIHALSGENGAGKSTLMKILFGEEKPTEGEIFIEGKKVGISNPKDALRLGIGMVHQHFMLVPSLTVLDNIILGAEPRKGLFIDHEVAKKKAESVMQQFHMVLDLGTKVEDLSVGQKQKLEILKILIRGARILILDEPTAVLTPQETTELFQELILLKQDNYSIIFISHKLNEVRQLCSRITIIRHGEGQGTFNMDAIDDAEILRKMVGRSVAGLSGKQEMGRRPVALQVHNLVVKSAGKMPLVNDIGFSIRSGEILGVAGVEGNGQGELVLVLSGMKKASSGVAKLQGKVISDGKVEYNRSQRISHIPEDRMTIGMAGSLSITENILADKTNDGRFFRRGGTLDMQAMKAYGTEMVKKYDILCQSPSVPVSSLSGGNIQKVVLARELDGNPALVIADQPTRGVDVGASHFIREKLIDLRNHGCAILLVSSDLQELLSLSDRIIVMVKGKIAACVTDLSAMSEEALGRYMLGLSQMGAEMIRRNTLEDE